MFGRNELANWTEKESNDGECQTETALTPKAFSDNASAMLGTDSNRLSDDLRGRPLWRCSHVEVIHWNFARREKNLGKVIPKYHIF